MVQSVEQYTVCHGTMDSREWTSIAGMLLSGLGGSYVSEWNLIYKSILNFVWNMYDNRQCMYDILLEGPGW